MPPIELIGIALAVIPVVIFLAESHTILAALVVLSPLLIVLALGLVYAIIQNRITAYCGDLVEARAFQRKKKEETKE